MTSPSEELWISRAIDRRASEHDWRGLESIARDDADVWRRLGHTLRAECRLARRVDALVGADGALPAAAPPRRRRRAAAGIAALLALALTFGLGRLSAADAPPATAPLVGAPRTTPRDPDWLMSTYLDAGRASGRVVEPLPLQTLATRRLPDGAGVEVLFVRSIVERARVDSALALAPDELGRPTPRQVDLTNYIPPTNF